MIILMYVRNSYTRRAAAMLEDHLVSVGRIKESGGLSLGCSVFAIITVRAVSDMHYLIEISQEG